MWRLVQTALLLFVVACGPKKIHGMWLRGETDSALILGFSLDGPTIHVPLNWSAVEAGNPKVRAKFTRVMPSGLVANCQFRFHLDSKFRGKTPKQFLDEYYHPKLLQPKIEIENERGFAASLEEFRDLEVNGLPAWESEWSSTADKAGLSVPVRSRIVAVGYKQMVMWCTCSAPEQEFSVLSQEFDEIQKSFKPKQVPQ